MSVSRSSLQYLQHIEAILISTHKIGFCEDFTKIIFQLSSNMHLISSSAALDCLPSSSGHHIQSTIMIQNFWTNRSGQTVQTQIRLLLKEQSDQGLHCLLCHLPLFEEFPRVWPRCLNLGRLQQGFWASENLGTLR